MVPPIALALGRAQTALALATELIGSGRMPQAADQAVRAVELGLASWQEYLEAARILVRSACYEGAIKPLRIATQLEPGSPEVLKMLAEVLVLQDRFVHAVDALIRLTCLVPGDWTVHQNLATALRRLSRRSESIAPMVRVTQLQPKRADLHHTIALSLIEAGKPVEATPHYSRAARDLPEVLGRKVAFYTLRNILEGIWGVKGAQAAYDVAIELLDHIRPETWAGHFDAKRDATRAFLAETRDRPPNTPFDRGIDLLLNGQHVAALRAYAAALSQEIPLAEKYATVLDAGPDAAHPAWHLMNPYYYLWADSRQAETSTPQLVWQTYRVYLNASATAKKLAPGATAWNALWPIHDVVLELLAAPDFRRGRILDMGCGLGDWLRFMAVKGGVPVESLYGCDFHTPRVTITRDVMRQTAVEQNLDESAADAVAESNVFQCDLLQWNAHEFRRRHGPVDLVTMFSLASVFDDQQLGAVVEKADIVGARLILEHSPVDSWEHNMGRADARSIFQNCGYRRQTQRLLGEPANAEAVRYLVLPRKYWPGMQVSIYARI